MDLLFDTGLRFFGELAQLSRVHEYEKEYRVHLARRPDQEQLEAWKRGVILEDGYKTAPVDVRFEARTKKAPGCELSCGRGGSVRSVRRASSLDCLWFESCAFGLDPLDLGI